MAANHGNHSATITATATAIPPHVLTREDVKTYMRKVFDAGERRLDGTAFGPGFSAEVLLLQWN
jgi:predicted naringenin-chalcone synthase